MINQASTQMYMLPTLNNEKYVIDAMMTQTLQEERMFNTGFVTFQSKGYKALSVLFRLYHRYLTNFIQLKEG